MSGVPTDRILPHNVEAEKAVLGAILVNNAAFERAAGIIKPRDFFRRAHADIFATFVELLDMRHSAVDLLTVSAELERLGTLDECGGPAYISSLTDGVPRGSNVVEYCRLVKDTATRRRLIFAANEMLAASYDGEKTTDAIVTDADRAIIALQRGGAGDGLVSLREDQTALMEDLEYRYEHRGQLSGVETGFPSINEQTFGWQRADMIVVAARPSIGKSAWVLNTAVAAAKGGARVGIFSLEMKRRSLERRILAMLSGVPVQRIRGGFLGEEDFQKLADASTVMHDLNFWIDDRSGQSVWDIRSACRRLKSEQGLDLIVVDYVQLMPGSLDRRGATRNDEMTDISRRMKAVAGEVDAALLLLSQLSRAGEKEGRRPVLSDLRESGALEQDADLVCFLHRRNHKASGKTNFIIEKQRDGPTGTVDLSIDRDTQIFTDLGMAEEPAPEAPPPAEGEAPPARKRGRH